MRKKTAAARFPVELLRAGAESLPFDSKLDCAVTDVQPVHHRDPAAALRELHRVLRLARA